MSTKVSTTKREPSMQPTKSYAAHNRSLRRRRLRRIRAGVFCGLLCTIAVMGTSHHKEVRKLNSQIFELTGQVDYMEDDLMSTHEYAEYLTEESVHLNNYTLQLIEENKALTDKLLEAEQRLKVFVDTNEVQAGEVVTYNIPLDAALQEFTYNMCVNYSIPEYYELVLAMMWHESNFKPSVVSSTNDYGLMQINTFNHSWLSEELGINDFLDPEQNIHAGVYMIAKLLHKYDDMHKALMAYNMGERGAASFWEIGTYSSIYSRDISDKLATILSDSYAAN